MNLKKEKITKIREDNNFACMIRVARCSGSHVTSRRQVSQHEASSYLLHLYVVHTLSSIHQTAAYIWTNTDYKPAAINKAEKIFFYKIQI
jgi:hypothetical protein